MNFNSLFKKLVKFNLFCKNKYHTLDNTYKGLSINAAITKTWIYTFSELQLISVFFKFVLVIYVVFGDFPIIFFVFDNLFYIIGYIIYVYKDYDILLNFYYLNLLIYWNNYFTLIIFICYFIFFVFIIVHFIRTLLTSDFRKNEENDTKFSWVNNYPEVGLIVVIRALLSPAFYRSFSKKFVTFKNKLGFKLHTNFFKIYGTYNLPIWKPIFRKNGYFKKYSFKAIYTNKIEYSSFLKTLKKRIKK